MLFSLYAVRSEYAACERFSFDMLFRRFLNTTPDDPCVDHGVFGVNGERLLRIEVASYDCVVTNACGSFTSNAAPLSICYADFTCDTQVDDAEFVLFATTYKLFVCDAPAMRAATALSASAVRTDFGKSLREIGADFV